MRTKTGAASPAITQEHDTAPRAPVTYGSCEAGAVDKRAGEAEERDVDVCTPVVAGEQPFEVRRRKSGRTAGYGPCLGSSAERRRVARSDQAHDARVPHACVRSEASALLRVAHPRPRSQPCRSFNTKTASRISVNEPPFKDHGSPQQTCRHTQLTGSASS